MISLIFISRVNAGCSFLLSLELHCFFGFFFCFFSQLGSPCNICGCLITRGYFILFLPGENPLTHKLKHCIFALLLRQLQQIDICIKGKVATATERERGESEGGEEMSATAWRTLGPGTVRIIS